MSQPDETVAGDSCNENRLGLYHLRPSVASIADLEAAASLFDEMGISHGEIKLLERSASPCWRSATRITSRWS